MEHVSDLENDIIDLQSFPDSGTDPGESYPEEPVITDGGDYSGDAGSSADVVQLLTEIKQEVARHPAMTTPFEDYTVVEGLLLLLFLSVFCSWLLRLLKGGFAWLSW